MEAGRLLSLQPGNDAGDTTWFVWTPAGRATGHRSQGPTCFRLPCVYGNFVLAGWVDLIRDDTLGNRLSLVFLDHGSIAPVDPGPAMAAGVAMDPRGSSASVLQLSISGGAVFRTDWTAGRISPRGVDLRVTEKQAAGKRRLLGAHHHQASREPTCYFLPSIVEPPRLAQSPPVPDRPFC